MMLATVFVSATVKSTMSIEGFIFNVLASLVTATVAYFLCKRKGYMLEK